MTRTIQVNREIDESKEYALVTRKQFYAIVITFALFGFVIGIIYAEFIFPP